MNRPMPPRDRGHHAPDPERAFGTAGLTAGTCGLVGGVADDSAGREEARHSDYWAGLSAGLMLLTPLVRLDCSQNRVARGAPDPDRVPVRAERRIPALDIRKPEVRKSSAASSRASRNVLTRATGSYPPSSSSATKRLPKPSSDALVNRRDSRLRFLCKLIHPFLLFGPFIARKLKMIKQNLRPKTRKAAGFDSRRLEMQTMPVLKR